MKCWTRSARRDSLGRASDLLSLRIHLLLLISFLASPAGDAVSQEATLHSQSNVVVIPALVRNAKGEAVYGLTAKDFIVEDDGVEQPVRLDEAAEGSQISLVIAIQTGRRANYEFPRILGLGAMLAPMIDAGLCRVAIVEFDSRIRLVQDFSGNSEKTSKNLKALEAGDGGASILAAVGYAVKLLEDAPKDEQRVLLLISETRDHGSAGMKVENIVSAIGQSNTAVYTLAFSPTRSNMLDTMEGTNIGEMHEGVDFLALGYQAVQAMRKNTPKTIASMSGGEYDLFTTRKGFEGRMIDFSNHLRSRYVLSIEPKNPHEGLHRLQVRLREPKDREVLARSRYWALGNK